MSVAGPTQDANCTRPPWTDPARARPGYRRERRLALASIPAHEDARGPSPLGERRSTLGSAAANAASVGGVQ
jgi:hypothetical protein